MNISSNYQNGPLSSIKYLQSAPRPPAELYKDSPIDEFKQLLLIKYPELYCTVRGLDEQKIQEFLKKDTPCHFAIEHADYSLLELLIKLGADIHQRNDHGETPLMIAFKYIKDSGNKKSDLTKCINLLSKEGSNLLEKDLYGKSPIEYICKEGCWPDEEILTFLELLSPEELKSIAAVLHWTPSTKVIEYFIRRDISIETPDNFNYTPLMHAIALCDIPRILYLLKLGADLFSKKSGRGESAFDMLAKVNLLMDDRIIPFLEELSKEELQGATKILFPTHKQLNNKKPAYIPFDEDRLELITFLLQKEIKGFSVNTFDSKWDSPLFLALENEDFLYIHFLYENQADPELARPIQHRRCGCLTAQELLDFKIKSVNKQIMIYRSKSNSKIFPCVRKLFMYNIIQHMFDEIKSLKIEREIDLKNLRDSQRPLAAHLLHLTSKCDVVDILLSNGISIDSIHKGCTPLESAFKKLKWEFAEKLLEKGANPHLGLAFHALAHSKELDLVKLLVKKGGDINQLDTHGNNTLMKVCEYIISLKDHDNSIPNDIFILELISLGANPFEENLYGISPLKMILENRLLNVKQILELLSKLRPDLIQSTLGLPHAARNEDDIKSILSAGISIDERDANGLTPLCSAWEKGDIELMTLFLQNGANPNMPNSEGFTPLYLAVNDGDIDLVKLFLSHGADQNYEQLSHGTVAKLASTPKKLVQMKIKNLKAANLQIEQPSQQLDLMRKYCKAIKQYIEIEKLFKNKEMHLLRPT